MVTGLALRTEGADLKKMCAVPAAVVQEKEALGHLPMSSSQSAESLYQQYVQGC